MHIYVSNTILFKNIVSFIKKNFHKHSFKIIFHESISVVVVIVVVVIFVVCF